MGAITASPFGTVAVVGTGLIGGSIALAIEQRLPGTTVVTLERGDDIRRAAVADLVVLAAPVRANLELLEALRAHLAPAALITDTGSTKAAITAAAAGLRFIGGHPIAGAASSGRSSARGDLFIDRRWILTPTDGTDHDDVERLTSFVERLGSRVVTMAPEEHDRLFAFVSHLPQLTVSALMSVVGKAVGADGLRHAGPGLRDSTRLASSPADIWLDVVHSNRAHVTAALDGLIAALTTLRDDQSGEELRRIFESAARAKHELDS